jgi:hypothetical protein
MPGEPFARRVIVAPDLKNNSSQTLIGLAFRATGPFSLRIWLTKRVDRRRQARPGRILRL